MLKEYVVLITVGLFVFNLKTFSFAQCTRHKDSCCPHNQFAPLVQNNQKKAVNAGNKFCPVLNEKIDEKNKATYEYKGKIYNFCCALCIENFKKNPKKYIEKIQKENTLPDQSQQHSH